MRAALTQLAAALAISLGAAAVQAQDVSPIKLDVAVGQKGIALGLKNTTNAPKTYDIRVFSWTGTGAQGIELQPTTAVITARPVVTVPALQTATIRLAIVERTSAAADYYRVIVDDVTPSESTTSEGQAYRLRLSLPMQVLNTKSAKGNLKADIGALINNGDAAVFVAGSKKANGQANPASFRYLLPGEVWNTGFLPDDLVWSSGIQ